MPSLSAKKARQLWGYSSVGRALAWHARGQRFDPAYLHQFITQIQRFKSHCPAAFFIGFVLVSIWCQIVKNFQCMTTYVLYEWFVWRAGEILLTPAVC